MSTRYLRPIITKKEPKNKNVLWCHDNKISYFDGSWKECGGNNQILKDDIQHAIYDLGTLYLGSLYWGIGIGAGNNQYINENNKSTQALLLSTTLLKGCLQCDGNSLYLSTRYGFRKNPSQDCIELIANNSDLIKVNDYSMEFNFDIGSGIQLSDLLIGTNPYSFTILPHIFSDIQNEQSGIIFVRLDKEGSDFKILNLSTMQDNPIMVTSTNSSRWTLTDIQKILNAFQEAGYFTVKV